jgi:hypothetical protein
MSETAEYAFKIKSSQWSDDPYYVAPRSGTTREVEVVATTWKAAMVEAERVLGAAMSGYHWRHTMVSSRDVRLVREGENAGS